MRFAYPDRRQLIPSVLVVVSTLFFSRPHLTYVSILICVGLLLIGFFLSLNAVLDIKEMGLAEGIAAVFWFSFLLCLVPCVIYGVFTMESFSRK